MENQPIEQITDVPLTMPLSHSRVKNAKHVAIKGKPCIYFKEMQCRAPVCDLEICERCPEGGAYCTRINFIKKLVQKILMLIVGFFILSDL